MYCIRTVPSRRTLYRRAKRELARVLSKGWRSSRAALDRVVRAFLRRKDGAYLLRLVRQQAFALAVAGMLYGCSSGRSGSVSESAVVLTTPVELSTISLGIGGFAIEGEHSRGESGFSVSGAGDVNGDGIPDVIIGAPYVTTGIGDPNTPPGGNEDAGRTYVIFGKANGSLVDLLDVERNGEGGFVIDGIDEEMRSGKSVSGAGDVNGDGLDDLIVGVPESSFNVDIDSGVSYVIFGKVDFGAVELPDIAAGVGGFVITGHADGDEGGASVSGAGDVNGDGLADLIVGAPRAEVGTYRNAGKTYVVFGKADNAAVDVSTVESGVGGFAINGREDLYSAGASLSGAGDVNGDGLDDVIVGAPEDNLFSRGHVYVVFGKSDGAAVELSAIAFGLGGFVINGHGQQRADAGTSVSDAGDVNGDGFADIVVSAPGVDCDVEDGYYQDYFTCSGQSYVVFGKEDGAAIGLTDLAADARGFEINGIERGDWSGRSVSGAGDVNGDGLDDVIIGASAADSDGESAAGESYVVFGKVDSAPVELIDVMNDVGGFAIIGYDSGSSSGFSVSAAGDMNGDGFADVIVGAPGGDTFNHSDAGISYIVFSPISAVGRSDEPGSRIARGNETVDSGDAGVPSSKSGFVSRTRQ